MTRKRKSNSDWYENILFLPESSGHCVNLQCIQKFHFTIFNADIHLIKIRKRNIRKHKSFNSSIRPTTF